MVTTSHEPRRADAQHNRERILRVAYEAFAASSDASLNSIAKQAGVGAGTLYRHFPTREALLLAVYRHEVQTLVDSVAEVIAEYEPIEAVEGKAGRTPYDPRLLISLWLYSYREGIASAREIERRCAYDPAYQWLTGAEVVCAHTLSDFRTAHGEALKDFFSQVLATMAQTGLVDLQQVTQDGTKISAAAGSDTFRRKKTIEQHLEHAQKRVEELMAADNEVQTQQALAAQQRAAREKLQRLQQALEEVKALQKNALTEPEKVRVSTTDPEARIMKQNNGGFNPSYNVQLTTDARQIVIVSVDVTQAGNDAEQLQPAMQRVQQESGQAPQQAIADGSYTNRGHIVATGTMEELRTQTGSAQASLEDLFLRLTAGPESRELIDRLLDDRS